MLHTRIALAALPLLTAFAFVACGGDAERETTIHFLAFEEPTITVAAGTTVVWTNLDGDWHDVTAQDQSFESALLRKNDIFSLRFDEPGTYEYFCTIHPSMVGTVIVE